MVASTCVQITTLFIPTGFALNEEDQGRIQCAFSEQTELQLTEQIILNRNVPFPKKKGRMSIFFDRVLRVPGVHVRWNSGIRESLKGYTYGINMNQRKVCLWQP